MQEVYCENRKYTENQVLRIMSNDFKYDILG